MHGGEQQNQGTGKLGKAVPTLQKQAISISQETACLPCWGSIPKPL
jgi:hypothetical protein